MEQGVLANTFSFPRDVTGCEVIGCFQTDSGDLRIFKFQNPASCLFGKSDCSDIVCYSCSVS